MSEYYNALFKWRSGIQFKKLFIASGTPNIDPFKIKNDNNKIDFFELAIESKKPFDIYSDASSVLNGSLRTYRVNVRRLCLIFCNCVRAYYEENKDKFNFFKFTIIDWDNEVEKMKNLKL